MGRRTRKTTAINQGVDACFTRSPNGLVTNVEKGTVPSQYQSLARYEAQYVVRPPIAVRRSDRSDDHRGTYHSRSHRTERVEHATVDVDPCSGGMMQHTVPKGCQRIRYAGVQAPKTCAKVKGLMRAAVATGEGRSRALSR